MKKIGICDVTLSKLANSNIAVDFKKKVEIARNLAKLNVNSVQLPAVGNSKENKLLVSTVSAFVNNVTVSVCSGYTEKELDAAIDAIKNTPKPQICVALPMSAVQMEYSCHKKPKAMLEFIPVMIKMAKENCQNVEFCAFDATRADSSFLKDAILSAINAGATSVCVCDTAGESLPEEIGEFIKSVKEYCTVPLGIMCSNALHLANASEIYAIKNGADYIASAIGTTEAGKTDRIVNIIKCKSAVLNADIDIVTTEMNRCTDKIRNILSKKPGKTEISDSQNKMSGILLKSGDGLNKVSNAVKQLGYDLSADDLMSVFEAFTAVSAKRDIGFAELDAIVAANAMQVPATYKLKSYVINSGNIINATANVYLQKDGKKSGGISVGNGPIDAAFLAIEQIIGHHYELDDFTIQSITEGREAMGVAVVRLRSAGILYSGKGTSTDIIEASIYAYLNAVNKIIFEEARK